jgi:hypothetical protein
MSKKFFALLVSIVLVTVLLVSLAGPALAAAGDVYRIVLRYYDDIQITYTIIYPAGSDHDVWKGDQDIPVGGVGIPDPGSNFGIDPYISTQIYCADPFTPFHGRVPDLGGSFTWDVDSMAHTVTGYVSAAPWATSGAMQKYGDAVRWLAANGYRGVYNYFGDDDAESKASVARLNTMFPGAGVIDKEIALMATKVAIWKMVAGDNVIVDATTLDGTPKRAVFDALVTAMVNEAAKTLRPAPRVLLPGEVTVTSFSISINETAGAAYDEASSAAYNFYGPLTVTGALANARPGASLPDLEKVFLTASGKDSGGVRFVSDKTNNPADELPSDTVYATRQNAQYLTGTVAGNTWTSGEFYLAIPKSRTDPDRGDQLLIKAMAMAPDVEVAEGTPVVFAFSQGDVQDWDAIQAFVGGASSDRLVNLYAEATWNTGDTSLGDLYISKQVKNPALDIVDRTFAFAVYYGNSPSFSNAARLDLTDFPVYGAFSVNTGSNSFTLKNGGLALIQGLPMVVGGGGPGYEYYYWVEELGIGQDFETPQMEISIGTPPGLSVSGSRIGPFQLDSDVDIALALVTVTNTFIPPEQPEEPEEPEQPEEPEEPETPDNPPDVSGKTDDSRYPVIAVVVLVFGIAGSTGIVWYRRRRTVT